MTLAWYIVFAFEDKIPEIDRNSTFCYVYSLRSFIERDRAYHWENNQTRWEMTNPLEPSMGGEYTIDQLRVLQNATNCCVVVPGSVLSTDPDGPPYLTNIRKYYKVEAKPPGSRTLVMGPQDWLADHPVMRNVADRLRAAVPVSIPWDHDCLLYTSPSPRDY